MSQGGGARSASSHIWSPVARSPSWLILLVRSTLADARPARSPSHRVRPGARPPQAPPPPVLAQRGMAGPAAHAWELDQHPAAATSIRPRDSNQPRRSTALPLRAVEYALPIRTSAAQPARQAPLNPGLSRWLLPLVPHRTRHRFATTNARRNQLSAHHVRANSKTPLGVSEGSLG